MAVPVRIRDHCLGVIELVNCVGASGFEDRDMALLEALADFAAIAIENARHVQRIQELTITDDCTTLYNARHLHFRFSRRKFTGRKDTATNFHWFLSTSTISSA